MSATARFAACITAVGLVAVSCARPSESQRYLDAITVDGYRKTGEGYEAAPLAYFVGPARDDVIAAIHGPGDLRIAEDDINLSATYRRDLGSGVGVLDGDVSCRVLVFRDLPNGSVLPYVGKGGRLTKKEAAGVIDGTIYVLQVSSLCEPQADR